MFGFFKRRRRRKLRQQPFPDEWREIIERNVPYWHRLTSDEQAELLGHTQIILHEKHFEGCGGLELTDEIRVTIASQAAILLLSRETNYFPKLISILVYPSRYVADQTHRLPDGTIVEGPQVRLGESWHRGVVVLSWDNTRHGAVDQRDGHNVVLHEFAHQLDAEWGSYEGAPALPHRSMYADWARVLGTEYEKLRDDASRGRRTVLHPYGATNPAEFFAVATETFFEKPKTLKRRHPELYEQLRLYYNQDPVERY